MGKMDYFLELFCHLPRGGPGDNDSTRKAFSMMEGLPPIPRILDIGCGPGVQTLELAKISGGSILALDNLPLMLERMDAAALQEGLVDCIESCLMDMNEMDFEEGSFDVIWSEGAIYNLGFKKGLGKVKKFVKVGGYVVVTEPVWLNPNPPEEVCRFWEEYPEIDSIEKKLNIISDLEYQEVGHFVLPDSSWLRSYYEPLGRRVKEMEPVWAEIPLAMEVIQEAKLEMYMFKKYHKFYGYCFFVMRNS
jgi:SAM-dependent methyltransferase